MNSHDLAVAITDRVRTRLEQAVASYLPDLRFPRVFAGHRVDDATTATLLTTVTGLLDLGVESVGDVDLRAAGHRLLASVDPETTEGFSAFFVGESAARLGGLSAVSDPDAAVQAARSQRTVDLVRDGQLPANWIVVATRCLLAEATLTGHEPPDLAEFLERTATLFSASQDGWINDGMGGGTHYDAYTPDVYLFAEPLADHLGTTWAEGLRRVVLDLDELAQPGGAIVWGRSIGALGLALTPELAGIATRRRLADHPEVWLERARQAAVELDRWFPGGAIAAHQNRSSDFYRGPERRLQMTFDVLTKLLRAATDMQGASPVPLADPTAVWPPVDRLFRFEEESTAGAWTFRSASQGLAFALPIQQGWTTDYLPSLRSPGLFECPTNGHPCFLPTIHASHNDEVHRLVPAGLAALVEHHPGRLELHHRGWAPPVQGADDRRSAGGHRRVMYHVEGRTVTVDEDLEFDDVGTIESLSLLVPEIEARPLDVTVEGGDATVVAIDTSGLADWRSYWSEISRVHQIEVPVSPRVRFRWQVQPQLRVGNTIQGTAYDRALYEPLRDRVRAGPVRSADRDRIRILEQLADIDVLHLGWPEWFSGTDPERTESVIDAVEASGVTVVWTMHNLLPHQFKHADAAACYQQWAAAAHGVIHHSAWGEALARSAYDYRPDAFHTVIPHGHWAERYRDGRHRIGLPQTREVIEHELGWPPCAIRLSAPGSPRVERDFQAVLDGFHACDRDDLQLVIRVDGDEQVPDDPRIILDRGRVDESTFFWRSAAIDGLVLPITRPGMLTTGTAFDAIGGAMAPITSDWGFFDEIFDGHDIRFGSTAEDLRRCLDSLTPERVETCRNAMVALQPRYDWNAIADRTATFLQTVATR